MNYDIAELSGRVRERREKFVRAVTLLSLTIVASTVIAILFPETTILFVCITLAVVLFAVLISTVRKFQPSVLFSKEISGINIKEHEYVTIAQSHMRSSRYLGFYAGRYNQTGSAKGVRALVYLKLSDGDVAVIDGLSKVHTDIYEDGDELLLPSGAKYPIVMNRTMKKQPCPICGTVNCDTDVRCRSCGLGIVK